MATRLLILSSCSNWWTSSSPDVRSPGLKFRRIVFVVSVGDVEDEGTMGGVGTADASRCGNGRKGRGGLCQW